MKPVFVCPWYGPDIPGGAEAEARRTVENLLQRGEAVEVWTTCLKGFEGDWAHNYYPAGEDQVNGVPVKRFPVGPRNGELFDSLNRQVMSGARLSREEEGLFFEHMIRSPALIHQIQQQGHNRLFFFIPYLFSTTVLGARIHPDRSFIIPCLHDEGYARLTGLGEVFHRVRGLIFHTRVEMALGRELFSLGRDQSHLFGEGIDTDLDYDPERFRSRYRLKEPFVLYAGRRDRGKNTPLLMDYFARFKQRHPSDLKLVLIGNLPVRIPPGCPDILDYGFVPKQDKYDAYGAAALFCQPSVLESFSIVIMESWLCGTPVLVNARCPVTVEHCRESQGGLYFGNYPEFEEALLEILTNRSLVQTLVRNGKAYVLSRFHWDLISARYRDLIRQAREALEGSSGPKEEEKSVKPIPKPSKKALHQMLPDFSYGDAIGNDVLNIQKVLRGWGHPSDIYAHHVHAKLAGTALPYGEYPRDGGSGRTLLFHFSIGSELSEFVKRLPDRKILIYHNITPPHFFKGFNAEVERRCAWGYEELKQLAPHFELALGVSDFNRRELEGMGFRQTGVLPIFLDFNQYYLSPEEGLKQRLRDGTLNILHVGRIVPQKKIEDLIKVFYLFQKRHVPDSRLLLVGTDSGFKNYSSALKRMVGDLGLAEKVHFEGFATFRGLITYYANAHLYLCLSEHEGFCVPLLESMFFGLPIIAYLTGGIPETLGGSGLGISEKKWDEIAEGLALLTEDRELREKIIAAQKEQLRQFSWDKTAARLKNLLHPFLEEL